MSAGAKLQGLRQRLDKLAGAQSQIQKDLDWAEKQYATGRKEEQLLAKARDIIHAVALKTQQEVQLCLEEAVSHSLQTVFHEGYAFHVDFEIKRNRTEALLSVSRAPSEEKINPMMASGGGVVDIISFSLKVLLWSIADKRTHPVILLDEPFRFVSADLQPQVGQLLQEISSQMGIQFIIVTHEEELIESASAVFSVRLKKGVSLVL